jgi:hypothetical protein
MAAKRDLSADDADRSVSPRGFALAPGETAEQFLAVREELLRSAGLEPRWPGAAEIRRRIEAGELGTDHAF